MHAQTVRRPWYREPIMWLVIAPPLFSVIAGVVTGWLIMQHPERDVRIPHPETAVIHGTARNSIVPPAG